MEAENQQQLTAPSNILFLLCGSTATVGSSKNINLGLCAIPQAIFNLLKNNLGELIDYLKDNKVTYSKIFSERPTLNDVFLELTGKELRD